MVNNYEKPIVLENEELAEGVYAASGAVSGGGTTTTPTVPENPSPQAPVCDSIYIKGSYRQPDHSDWLNGTNLNGRGCEGCPACWSNGVCHVASYPAEEDCRPSWEKFGYGPNERWDDCPLPQ